MKKHIFLLISTFFLFVGFFACLYLNRGSVNADLPISFQIEGKETIDCWEKDNHLYLFLPSYAKTENVTACLNSKDSLFLGGEQLFNGDSLDRLEINKEYEVRIGSQKSKTIIVFQSANVGAMYIDTATGNMDAVHADKNHKENVRITVYTKEGKVDYRSEYTDQIRGHGNATWKKEKKAYNLYLKESAEFLEMNSSSKWVLLANAYDTTNLRSKLIFDFIKKIQPYEGFSPECEFVDLYLNGEYRGLYLCCSDVTTVMNDAYGNNIDYFFGTASASQVDKNDPNSFEFNTGAWIEVKIPKNSTKDEIDYLYDYLKEMQIALLDSEGYNSTSRRFWDSYIDMDSWARKYLIEEVFLNCDTAGSQYFFMKNGDEKVYIGTCWDYDGTLGSVYYMSDPCCFVANRDWVDQGRYTPWYRGLWEKKQFRDYVFNLYDTTFLPVLKDLIENELEIYKNYIEQASLNNALRWGTDWNEALETMVDFFQNRISFLNSAYVNRIDYKMITLKGIGASCIYAVVNETKFDNLPTPEERGNQYMRQWGLSNNSWEGQTNWYYERTDEVFDSNTIISTDIVLYAKQNPTTKIENRNNFNPTKVIVFSFLTIAIASAFAFILVVDINRNRRIGND